MYNAGFACNGCPNYVGAHSEPCFFDCVSAACPKFVYPDSMRAALIKPTFSSLHIDNKK